MQRVATVTILTEPTWHITATCLLVSKFKNGAYIENNQRDTYENINKNNNNLQHVSRQSQCGDGKFITNKQIILLTTKYTCTFSNTNKMDIK